jgi:hypothetical protein
VTEHETLRQHAEKIRELLGQPATRRRTPPLIDHDGVMRCQSQKCRKPFEDGEAVFQVRYAGGIKTFCERLLRDNLGEKAATIWMGIGGRGLTLIVAH